jgi:hypothetical protein
VEVSPALEHHRRSVLKQARAFGIEEQVMSIEERLGKPTRQRQMVLKRLYPSAGGVVWLVVFRADEPVYVLVRATNHAGHAMALAVEHASNLTWMPLAGSEYEGEVDLG